MATSESYKAGLTRRDLMKGAAALGGAFALTPILNACGGGTSSSGSPGTSGAPSRGGVLNYATADAFAGESLDPALSITAFSCMLNQCVYDPLVRIRSGDQWDWKTVPVLAESFEVNADGTKWQAKLRKGVVFHDGTPLTAKDVVYTVRRVLDEKLGSTVRSYLSALPADGMTAVDDVTVDFALSQPDYLFDYVFGVRNLGIVKDGSTPDTVATSIGSGPFKLKSFESGTSWEVERNPDFWGDGLPYLDGVRAVATFDMSSKVQGVLGGQFQLCDEIDFTQAKPLKDSGDPHLRTNLTSGPRLLVMDTKSKPFTDPNVLTAFKLAADRALILQSVYQGMGVASPDIHVRKQDAYYPPTLELPAYDPEQAKSLLAQAGYPDGVDVQLFTAAVMAAMPELAAAYKETAAKAGIRVSVKQWAPETYWDQVWFVKPFYAMTHPYDFPPFQLLEYYMPDATMNEAGIKDQKYAQWYNDVSATADPQKRTAIVQEALAYAAQNWSFIIPAAPDSAYLAAPNLKGLEVDPSYLGNWVRDGYLGA